MIIWGGMKILWILFLESSQNCTEWGYLLGLQNFKYLSRYACDIPDILGVNSRCWV